MFLKLIHTRHEHIADLQSRALLALADDVSSLLRHVDLNLLGHEFNLGQHAVSLARLRNFHIADSVLL